jgi:hypothetical protein
MRPATSRVAARREITRDRTAKAAAHPQLGIRAGTVALSGYVIMAP